jgi:hypothetical protein
MKSKISFFIAVLFLSAITTISSAQTTIPKGKAQLIEFKNSTANFTVPEGKTWVIYNLFSDYVIDGTVKYNERSKKNEYTNSSAIRIFIKDLNGVEKTNYQKNIYGTQLYRSTDASMTIPFPIIFPEKTTFSLVIVKGDLGNLQLHNNSSYISFIEVDN